MEPAQKVQDLIESAIEALGFELVRVSYGGGRRPTLQVMAERPDGTMSIDDCSKLSREISARLDERDPIEEAFLLEVSSPGIDRPLTRAKDFERWAGFDIKLEMKPSSDAARRRYKGQLHGVKDEMILITPMDENAMISLPIADFNKAKLLLTDALLKAVENNFKGYPAERIS